MLQEGVLYFDTDSVIYVHKDGLPEPLQGERFGDFKSELAFDDYITEFWSGGPKNYGYRTLKGKDVLKVRGFTLLPEARIHLNYESARDIVKRMDFDAKIKVPQGWSIARDKDKWALKSVEKSKDYRVVYDKRKIVPGTYNTLPWGYCNRKRKLDM